MENTNDPIQMLRNAVAEKSAPTTSARIRMVISQGTEAMKTKMSSAKRAMVEYTQVHETPRPMLAIVGIMMFMIVILIISLIMKPTKQKPMIHASGMPYPNSQMNNQMYPAYPFAKP